MLFFNSALAARIVFILGIVNLIAIAAIVFSCRVFPTSRILKPITKNAPYQRFYKIHGYLWWVLGASVIVHVIFAVGLMGIPF